MFTLSAIMCEFECPYLFAKIIQKHFVHPAFVTMPRSAVGHW